MGGNDRPRQCRHRGGHRDPDASPATGPRSDEVVDRRLGPADRQGALGVSALEGPLGPDGVGPDGVAGALGGVGTGPVDGRGRRGEVAQGQPPLPAERLEQLVRGSGPVVVDQDPSGHAVGDPGGHRLVAGGVDSHVRPLDRSTPRVDGVVVSPALRPRVAAPTMTVVHRVGRRAWPGARTRVWPFPQLWRGVHPCSLLHNRGRKPRSRDWRCPTIVVMGAPMHPSARLWSGAILVDRHSESLGVARALPECHRPPVDNSEHGSSVRRMILGWNICTALCRSNSSRRRACRGGR